MSDRNKISDQNAPIQYNPKTDSCKVLSLLLSVFIVRAKPCLPLWSFSLIRKTELWKTNKPPAMQVSQHCFSLQKKTSGGIINVGSPTALIYTGGIHMDNNSLSHTKWNCKYHIGATCGRCLKCAHALSPPFVIFLPRNA